MVDRIECPVEMGAPDVKVPHVGRTKTIDYYGDGRLFEVGIFSGDGRQYDEIAAGDPMMPRRIGSITLRPLCPVIEQIKSHRKNSIGLSVMPVAIRVPSAAIQPDAPASREPMLQTA